MSWLVIQKTLLMCLSSGCLLFGLLVGAAFGVCCAVAMWRDG